MTSDTLENVQWGLIQIGGCSSVTSLSAEQRRQMHTLERANLIDFRTMGSQRYLNTVRQQNRGVVQGGDNTDVNMGEEGEEEGNWEEDPPLPDEGADLMQVVTTFRNDLNSCLEREQ